MLVTSESPVVDLQSTKVGVEFSAEKLAAIPSATDLWAALGQAPGVRMLGFDVGGSHKSQQTGYESFGVRDQNRVVTDGVDTTEGTGGAGIYQDFFAHEEVSVSASGADVSMSTPGSAVVSTIKSGGNEFKSLNNVTYEGSRFVDNNIDDETRARGFTGQPNLKFWEAHFDLGGPIKRDKAWFYAAYNAFKIDKVISGVPRQFTDLAVFDNYTVKGTYRAVAEGHAGRLLPVGREGQAAARPVVDGRSGQHPRAGRAVLDVERAASARVEQPPVHRHEGRLVGLRVADGAGGRLAAVAAAHRHGDERRDRRGLAGGQSGRTVHVPARQAAVHDDGDVLPAGEDGRSRLQGRDRVGRRSVAERQQRQLRTDPVSRSQRPDRRDPRHRLQHVRDVRHRVDRAGRSQRALVGVLPGSLASGEPHDDHGGHPLRSSAAALRSVDPQADPQRRSSPSRPCPPRASSRAARSCRVSASPTTSARRASRSPRCSSAATTTTSPIASRAPNPGGTNRRDYRFNDLNGNRLFDGVQELGALVASAGGSTTTVDPNLKTPYADEISVSYEQQFWGESSLRVAYVRKMTRDDFATYNVLREGQFTVPRNMPIQFQDFGQAAGETRTFLVYDIPDSLRGQVRNVIASIPDSVGGGDNNFDTIQFAFIKRLPGGLFVQSSFDYQWRDELRTTANPSNSPLDSDPLAINYFQNVFPDVSNRQESTNWQGRLMGRYETSNGFGVAVNWRIQSGWAYARLMSVALPNAGTQVFFLEDIKNNRSDMASLLDLRVEKSFRFAREIQGRADGRSVQRAELERGHQLQPVERFALQLDQRDARSADGDDRRALRVLEILPIPLRMS